jgi:hypothetical protein
LNFSPWGCRRGHSPTRRPGDIDILRFLAALEILETDLWQQYNELGGIQDSEVPGGSGSPQYTKALKELDGDLDQYIHDNTEDEFTHFNFNAYLTSKRATPESGCVPHLAEQHHHGRPADQTPHQSDAAQWTHHGGRATAAEPRIPISATLSARPLPASRRESFRPFQGRTPISSRRSTCHTAAFHFATIEQGGTSLYPSEVLRILLSIGPTEALLFQTWQDRAGNFIPLTDPTNGLVFPDLNKPPFGGEDFQTNLIMPEPTKFLSANLPVCSIVRPTATEGAATGALTFLTNMGLFIGQSQHFATMQHLAKRADAAVRGASDQGDE